MLAILEAAVWLLSDPVDADHERALTMAELGMVAE
jgi:hypothetical protein